MWTTNETPDPEGLIYYLELLASLSTPELLTAAHSRYNFDVDPVPRWVHICLQAELSRRRGVQLLNEGVGESWV